MRRSSHPRRSSCRERGPSRALRDRDRSGDHTLRPFLLQPARGEAARLGANGFAHPTAYRAGDDRGAAFVAVLLVPAQPARICLGSACPALGQGPPRGGWRVRPCPRRQGSSEAGLLGEKLALPPGRRSKERDLTLASAAGGLASFAARRLGKVSAASA